MERLRSHIEDKNPVVQIADAVIYFKKSKPSSKKCSSKRYKTLSKYSRDRKTRDMLLLCAIFGYKITKKLLSPANIILNEELAKINYIVKDEINSILCDKKHKNSYKNDKVLAEISKKVTIWIASVLEETSYKQLLEQLDELEEKEGPVLDLIDELLDSIPILCESSSGTDFPEERDIMRSISSRDNVEIINSVHEDFSKETIDIQKADYIVPAHVDQILSENVAESISDTESDNEINEKTNIKNHLRSLLDDRINYIVGSIGNVDTESSNNTASADNKAELSLSMEIANRELPLNLENNMNNVLVSTNKEVIDKANVSIPMDSLEADKTLNNTASNASKAELSSVGNAIELPLSLENNIKNVLTSNEKEHIQDENSITLENASESDRPSDNSSENFKQSNILAEVTDEHQNDSNLKSDTVDEVADLTDEEINEGTKKVKFSDLLRDDIWNNTGVNKFELGTYDYKEPVVWKSSKEYISAHFHIGPANPNLLSDADELWPESSLPPLLKATESVSKSVTSLGRIIESDEHSLMSPIDKSSKENVKNSVYKRPDFAKIKSKDEDIRTYNNKIDSTVLEDDFLNEVLTKEWQRESRSTTDNEFMNNIQDTKIQTSTEKITQDCGDVQSIKPGDYIGTQYDVSHMKRPLTKKKLETYSNYPVVINPPMRVDKNVQTSSVIIFKSYPGEVSLKHNDLRKWCIGLENVTDNLDLWAEWIQNVCLNALLLKHKENTSKSCQFTTRHINKWVNLKKSIDIDAQRWFELKRNLCCGLKRYKRTYCKAQKALFIQADKKGCKCNKNSKKNVFLISTNILQSLLQS